ncbi:MAG: hypothetical protein QM733_21465 [Ilumatobacteraceae bacterium]
MVPLTSTPSWRRKRRRAALLVFCASTIVYCLSPNVTNFDSFLAYPTAVSIVHHGDLDLDEYTAADVTEHYGNIALDGHRYDRYPWVVSLVFVPAVVVIDAAAHVGIGGGATALITQQRSWLVQLAMAALVTGLAAALVTVLAFDRSRARRGRRTAVALAVGLVFAFGTSSWSTASRSLWQHGPSMALLAGALLVADRALRRPRPSAFAWLGVLTALAYTVRPTNAVVVAAFGVWCATRGWRRLVWYCCGGAPVALVWLSVNWSSYRMLIPPYFQSSRLGVDGTFTEALLANLFSPSRGLFVFAPVALFAVAGVVVAIRERRFDSLLAVAVAVFVGYLLVVSAGREAWWAGDSIGPRFLCDTLPMLALLAVPAVDRLLTPRRARTWSRSLATAAALAAVVWSVLVNGGAAVMRATSCWNVQPASISADPERVWSVRRPQVVEGYVELVEDGPAAALTGTCTGSTATTATSTMTSEG